MKGKRKRAGRRNEPMGWGAAKPDKALSWGVIEISEGLTMVSLESFHYRGAKGRLVS